MTILRMCKTIAQLLLIIVSTVSQDSGPDKLICRGTRLRVRIEIDSVLNQNRLGVCKHGLGTVRSVVAFRSNFIAVDFIDVGKNWSKAPGIVQLHLVGDQSYSQPSCIENPNTYVDCVLQTDMIGTTHHSKITSSKRNALVGVDIHSIHVDTVSIASLETLFISAIMGIGLET